MPRELAEPTTELKIFDDKGGDYFFDHEPELREGEIVHFMKGSLWGEKKHRFLMLKTVSELHYIFSLSQYYGEGVYQLSFKTREYGSAVTNLDKESFELLCSEVAKFVETAAKFVDDIREIRISPADSSYTSEEIEKCIDEVLALPGNKFTRKDLEEEYSEFRIFDLYKELTGKNFHPIHYNWKSRATARSRLFRMMIGKYFPDWEIDISHSIGSADFSLVRKAI